MTVADQDGDGDGDEVTLEFPRANIVAVREVARILASTLGPGGQEKLLVPEDDSDPVPGVPDQDVIVTGDGATILESLPIAHPLAPVIRRVIGPERPGDTDVEGERIPEGITTRVVFAAALLVEAEELLDRGVHPRTITAAYRRARKHACEGLAAETRSIAEMNDPHEARLALARTAMTGNDVGGLADRTAEMALEAVEYVGLPDEISFGVVETRHGPITETRLIEGTVLDRLEPAHRRMPSNLEDANVLVLEGQERGGLQERDTPEDATAKLRNPGDATGYEDMRMERKQQVVESLAEADVDLVATQLGIDEAYQRLLADRGILGVRAVTSLQRSRLAAATGATPVLDVTDVEPSDLGRAGSVEQVDAESYPRRGARRSLIVVDECPAPDSVTVLLRGLADQPAGQATTQLRNAAVSIAIAAGEDGADGGVLPGGGAAHLAAAEAVRAAGRETESREQLPIVGYADAIDRTVRTLAANAGLDGRTALADLRAAREGSKAALGFDLPDGEIVDAVSAGILDPAGVVRDTYRYGTDLAILVLGIDDTIDAVEEDSPAADG